MASIEERLDREDWDPQPGQKLIGTITGLSTRTSKKGGLYPVMVVKDERGGEHVVSCALFADDVITYAPNIGERVGVKFVGPQPRRDGDGNYDKYVVAFEKEPAAEIDWADMAGRRGITTQATTLTDLRDDGSEWDSAEPPDDEPAF